MAERLIKKTQTHASRMAWLNSTLIFGVTWGVEPWSSYNPREGYANLSVLPVLPADYCTFQSL